MNKNAKALYENLKAGNFKEFCMLYVESCGTPQCILGHALHEMGELDQYRAARAKLGGTLSDLSSSRKAFKWLGLDTKTATALCFPETDDTTLAVWGQTGPQADATQEDAADALKRACEMSKLRETIRKPKAN